MVAFTKWLMRNEQVVLIEAVAAAAIGLVTKLVDCAKIVAFECDRVKLEKGSPITQLTKKLAGSSPESCQIVGICQ